MPFGGILSAIGAVAGGVIGANGAQNAAKIQANAANNATNLQGLEYSDIAAKLQPFLQRGTTADQVLSNNYFGVSPTGTFNPNAPFLQPISSTVGAPPSPTDPTLVSQFRASPGYQYALDQSGNAIQNSAAGKTGAISGNMLKALQTNATGLADQDFSNFYTNLVNNYSTRYNDVANNRNQIINVLSALGGQGQNAAAQLGGFGQNAVTSIGNNLNLAGSAQAAGTLGTTNAITNAVNSLANNSSVNSALSFLFNGGSGSGSGGGSAGGDFGGPGY